MIEIKTCIKCGIEKPATVEHFVNSTSCKNGIRGTCKECRRAEDRLFRKEHKDIMSARNAKSRESRKVEMAIYMKKYRQKNKEKIKVNGKSYRESNKEQISARRKIQRESVRHKETRVAYIEAHKEEIAAQRSIYNKNHKVQLSINVQKRQARKRKLLNTLTIEQWQDIMNHFNNKCAYCGKEKTLEQDHFYSLSLGGEYCISNIICACRRCNQSKHANIFSEWYPKQLFYSKYREKKILSYLKYKNKVQQLSFV